MSNLNLIPSPEERNELLDLLKQFSSSISRTPPIPFNDLSQWVSEFIESQDINPRFTDWLMVMANNLLWEKNVAAIPYKKRLLLLPQCLKNAQCPAKSDAFGLLCENCGGCQIDEIILLADELGMVTLVAEGTTTVRALAASGAIEAVIGVSCLEALERAFPTLYAHAIPSLALPLLRDGCANTAVDSDALREMMMRHVETSAVCLNAEEIRQRVASLFTAESLNLLMGEPINETDKIARHVLSGKGKRYRPNLVLSVGSALRESDIFDDNLKRAALAVECFHKASLIHDDIEDHDDWRYQEKTLHCTVGIPAALNVGDLLIGEGYRMLSEMTVPAEIRGELFRIAAEAHRNLCLGQGAEFCWMANPDFNSEEKILDIYRLKTAPAFFAALAFGALTSGAEPSLIPTLRTFSDMLGTAYQLRDDWDDFDHEAPLKSPSLLALWVHQGRLDGTFDPCTAACDKAKNNIDKYRKAVLETLRPLVSFPLKQSLFQMTESVLSHD